jgi:hypothetical protein
MEAAVYYALWVRRTMEKAPNASDLISKGFDQIPEVREVLDRHLDPATDPALPIRTIYGRWFPWLVLLDRDWAFRNIPRIFPPEQTLQDFRNVAWESYIVFCEPYYDVFELLREEYGRAIDRIRMTPAKKGPLRDPDKRLAEHLVIQYWRGKLDLDDPQGSLRRFYARAPGELRAHAIWYVGMCLGETKEAIEPEVTERLKRLLVSRINAARTLPKGSPPGDELACFDSWFGSGKFDDPWAIARLSEVLSLTQSLPPDFKMIDRLEILAAQMPLVTVQCLSRIIEIDSQGWCIELQHENIRKILKTAQQSGDEKARQEADLLINQLGARGYLQFRDMLTDKES